MNKRIIGPYELEMYLRSIGSHLNSETTLTLMGSGPNLLYKLEDPEKPGEYRTTIDIDCWKKTSIFKLEDLKQACEKSNILFNPKEFTEPDQPYLQLVEEGVADIPHHKPIPFNKTGKLTIAIPPAQDLIASKLLRGTLKDVSDCLFLAKECNTSLSEIIKSINKFSKEKREIAMDNLIMLKIQLPKQEINDNSINID